MEVSERCWLKPCLFCAEDICIGEGVVIANKLPEKQNPLFQTKSSRKTEFAYTQQKKVYLAVNEPKSFIHPFGLGVDAG